jgi:predicted dehydrogenase
VLHLGVIGCGYWGKTWLAVLSHLADCDVTAICDPDPDVLGAAHQLHPRARAYADPSALLFDPQVDAAIIATPAATHAPLAREALLAGKHVLVEKPLALAVQTAADLVRLAARKGLVLMVDHTVCHWGPARTLIDLTQRGELGAVRHVHAVRGNLGLFRPDVNVMWDLAIHDLAVIDAFMPGPPRSVAAVTHQYLPDCPAALAHIALSYPDGALARVEASWVAPAKQRHLVVIGSRQMALCTDLHPTAPLHIYERSATQTADGTVAYHHGGTTTPHTDVAPPLPNVAADFRDAVLLGRPPLTDGRSGLSVVRLLEAAERSARRGGLPQLLPERVPAPRTEQG